MTSDKCNFDINFSISDLNSCKISMMNTHNDENTKNNDLYKIEDNTRLCSQSDGKIYKNCVIEFDNPWLVRSGDQCIYPENMTLPKQLYRKDVDNNNLHADVINQEIDNISQERWYDWFTIPDYYHGNMYYLDRSNNENKIYEPCDLGKVPYPGNLSKCISKNDIDYGLYTNQISYTPLQLVLLYGYGTNSNLVVSKLQELRNSFKKNLEKSEDYEFIKDNEKSILEDFENSYINHNTKIHFDEIEKYMNGLNDLELDHIKAPIQNVIKVSDFIHSKENITEAWKLCSNIKPEIETKITSSPPTSLQDYEKKLYKACDICFNGNSFYSKNVIFFRLNEGEADKKQSLKFEKIPIDPSNPTTSNDSGDSSTQININKDQLNSIEYKTEKGFSQQKYSKYLLSIVKIMVVMTFITFISIFAVLILLAFKKQLIPFYQSMFSSVSSAGNFIRNIIASK